MIGVQAAISLRNESIILSGSIGGATVWYKVDLFGCQTVIPGEDLKCLFTQGNMPGAYGRWVGEAGDSGGIECS